MINKNTVFGLSMLLAYFIIKGSRIAIALAILLFIFCLVEDLKQEKQDVENKLMMIFQKR